MAHAPPTPTSHPAPAVHPPPPSPAPLAPLVAAALAGGPSKGAVAGGVGGAGLAIYILDRLLADDGQVAATMLTKLSPLLGPVWASWPVLVIVALVAWIAFDKWRASNLIHQQEVAQQRADAQAQQQAIHEVVTNVAGLRGEVHGLSGRLQAHTEATEVRLVNVVAEVAGVRARVETLERPPTPIKSRKPRAVAAAAKSSPRGR